MALVLTQRAGAGATNTTATTATFTPSANSRLFAFASGRAAGVVPSVSDSLGGTWTLVPGSNIDAGNVVCALYYQDIGGSPAAMTVTVTSSGSTQVAVGVTDITGHSTDLSNFVTNTNAAGDPSVTMGALTSGSAVIGWHAQNAGAAPTSTPAGYTSIYNSSPATNLRHSCFYDDSSPGTTLSWTSSGTDSIALGLEIKQAATGSAVGSSAGLATASAVGGSTIPAVGSAAGIATVSGVAASPSAVGSSAGIATASATGVAEFRAVAASAGVAAASSVGRADFRGVGVSVGFGTAVGVSDAPAADNDNAPYIILRRRRR